MKKILILNTLVIAMLVSSCTKSLPDYGTTATVKMSNGWWVNIQAGGSNLTATPTFFTTYNTVGNTKDSMWLDDLKDGYGFKCMVATNYTQLIFGAAKSSNEYYDGSVNFPATVSISNGKILPKAGHSRAGNVADSIYMEAVFSGDPTTYIIAGTERTGFDEDDY